MIDESAAYLKRTDLEATVTKALLQVINARAKDPQRMLWELLRPKGQDAEDDRNLVLEEELYRVHNEKAELVEKHAKLVERIASKDAKIAQLQTRDKELVDQAGDLSQQNEQLQERCNKLDDDSRRLERRLEELESMLQDLATGDVDGSAAPPSSTDVAASAATLSAPSPPPLPVTATAAAASLLPPAAAPPLLPADVPTRVSAASVSGRPSKIPRDVLDKLTKTMGKVFDSLDKHETARLSSYRLLAFTQALQQGCDASDNAFERAAMSKFIKIVERSVAGKAECGRLDLVAYVPSQTSFTVEEAETFMSVLSTILDNAEALEGLLEVVDETEAEIATHSMGEAEATAAFQTMMRRLFDEVLDQPTRGALPKTKVDDFARALRQGCDASDDDAEQRAMLAFVAILNGVSEGKEAVTRDAWLAYVPSPGVHTTADEERFIEILTTIVDNEEARAGLLETMSE